MVECSVKSLEKYYGEKLIFTGVTFDIKSGERVGLIGRNGTGKTTLMKSLMGKEDFNGEIHFRKGVKVAYLEQIPKYSENYTVIEVLGLAFKEVFEIKKKMGQLEVLFGECNEEVLEKEMKQYSLLQEQFQIMEGYEVEEKLNRITIGLKITSEMQQRSFEELSGGEKSRVILGKILLEEPDLLLLDEPSNHLDLQTIEWLEEYLRKYKGALLMVSHDRYFLDQVVTRIVEIETSGVGIYKGNYSYYVQEKEKRFLKALKDYNKQQKEIKKMEEQIKRFRIWGAARDSEKMFAQAKQLERRLEKIDKLDRPTDKEKAIALNAEGINRSGKEVLVVKEMGKRFDDNVLFTNLSFNLFYQERLGIIGKNGCGKSTLFKMILEEQSLDSGTIKFGAKVKLGYLAQEVAFDNEERSVLETFQYTFNLKIGEARKELAKVLFLKDDVFKRVSTLSGGEKSRLKLCMILYEKVNFLILDEPTNHLDIDSREILENTLAQFEGTILFISHDRYFINKIATRIGEIENKSFKVYEGDYEYYQEQKSKQAQIIEVKPKIKKESTDSRRDAHTQAQKDKEKLQKSLLRYEKEIELLEDTIKAIEDEMNKYSKDAEKLCELDIRKNKHKKELDQALEVWESISLDLFEYD